MIDQAGTARQILAAVDNQARAMVPAISGALKRAASRAAKLARDRKDPGAAVNGLAADLLKVVVPRVAAVGEVGAEQVRRAVGELETKAAATFTAARYDWAANFSARKVTQITNQTRILIRRRVDRAVRANMAPGELAADLRKALGGRIAEKRAERIARTELHQAANAGQFAEADRMRRENGTQFVKVWRSTRDARTRLSHQLADGQARPIGEPFTVGGVAMMHPGDPAAPGREVINCRCTQTLVPERAAQASGVATVRKMKDRLRAELGQRQADATRRGRLYVIERGGDLDEAHAGKLFDALAREAAQEGRAIAAPRSMSAVERRAFERLNGKRGLRLIKDADLPAGAIRARPQPPMILQLITEVDDTILLRDLIVMLTDVGDDFR